MTDDENDETDEIPDDLDLKIHVCEECGESFLTEKQKNAHKSKHSNYFEELREQNDDGES